MVEGLSGLLLAPLSNDETQGASARKAEGRMTEREALETLYTKAVMYIATNSNPYAGRHAVEALGELEKATLDVQRVKASKRGKRT